jgi:integrase
VRFIGYFSPDLTFAVGVDFAADHARARRNPSPQSGVSLTGHRDRIDKPFRRAVIAAGLDPELVTPHVTRHTGAHLPRSRSLLGQL